MHKLKEEFGDKISLEWKAYALAVWPSPDRKFSERTREEWLQCQKLGEGASYTIREVGSPMATHSFPALEAAKCALAQGERKFETFDRGLMTAYYVEGKDISSREVLKELATRQGLDVERFLKDYDSGAARPQIIADMKESVAKKLDGVPLVILSDNKGNAVRVRGEVPYARYRKLVKWFIST